MVPPAEPLRIIQVGAGSMGRAWLGTVAASTSATLVALVDLDPDVARRAAAETGHPEVVIATSVDEALARTGADAVLNVTVPGAHQQISTVALRHGLPVLCEKPLAETVSQGLVMVAAAELTDTLLMVSQSRRYYRQVDTFTGLIGQLGDIGSVDCLFRKAPHFGGFREEMAYPLLIDMAIHQFDLSRVLISSDPVDVQCESYNPGWSWYRGDAAANTVFAFGSGARFAFSGSWCAPGLETSWNGSWRVSGSEGSAVWDGDNPPTAEGADGQPLTAPAGNGPEAIAGSLAEFTAAVRSGDRQPAGEVHSNVISLAMVEAAVRSAEQRRRVTIAEILDDAYARAIQDTDSPDLRDVLTGWPSVHERVGLRSGSVTAAAPTT